MKTLARIKLINWHLFTNQTIELKGNCLLTGENGAGKSTFLDAIQYVLTGGKAKFNTAANAFAKRNIESYIRCKLGVENKTYLRSHDVTSHIAIEFYDETTHERVLLGVVMELNASNHLNEHFYLLKNYEFNDSLWFHHKTIRRYVDFKKALLHEGVNFTFCDTKEQTRRLFLNALGFDQHKYIELLPKALAFRPIDELNRFVYDFLLNEKYVNLDELRQNVQSFREFLSLISRLKEKEQDLRGLLDRYETHQATIHETEQLEKIVLRADYKIEAEQLSQLENQLLLIKEHIQKEKATQGNLSLQLSKCRNDLSQLQTLKKNQSQEGLIQDYLVKKENLLKQKQAMDPIMNDFETLLRNEREICFYFYEQFQNPIFQECAVRLEGKEIPESTFFLSVKQTLDTYREMCIQNATLLNQTIEDLKNKESEYDALLSKLQANQFSYPFAVTRLKTLIETIVHCPVDILCEIIDLSDDVWRNAVEGYLNTQKFVLLVGEDSFDQALEVYETYRQKERLFGVGLVNTKELTIYRKIVPHSLASKLKTENQNARNYLNMLLNNVQCVTNIHDLKKYQTAITPTCMVYRNYTVRLIHEDAYKTPYIGGMAIPIQMEQTRLAREKVHASLIEQTLQSESNQFHLQRLKECQIEALSRMYPQWPIYQQLGRELSEIETEIDSWEKSETITSLDRKITEQLEWCETVEALRNQSFLMEGKLSQEYDTVHAEWTERKNRWSNQSPQEDCAHLFDELVERHLTFEMVRSISIKQMKQNEQIIKQKEAELLVRMNQLNTTYHLGLEPTLDAIAGYKKELDQVTLYALTQYEQSAKESRLKCEIAFREQFLYKLRENILSAQEELERLNMALKGKVFGGDEYEFIYRPNHTFIPYYTFIMNSEPLTNGLLFEPSDSTLPMNDLFQTLMSDYTDEDTIKKIDSLCDYRNYMSYDIKIHHNEEEFSYFSKVNKEKSGGETQTPFYVVMAACFEQLANKERCFVMFDEAFNNMDESRIKAMMAFYNQLNIQLMIAVPPQRMDTIIPHVQTTLVVIKDKHQSMIETFVYENHNFSKK